MQKKKNLGEFLRPAEGGMLQSFPAFKCTDFLQCVRELYITLCGLSSKILYWRNSMGVVNLTRFREKILSKTKNISYFTKREVNYIDRIQIYVTL